MFRWGIDRLAEAGRLVRSEQLVSLPSHRIETAPETRDRAAELESLLAAGGFTPPDVRQLAEATGQPAKAILEQLATLEREGRAVRIAPRSVLRQEPADEAIARLTAHCRAHGEITAAAFRDCHRRQPQVRHRLPRLDGSHGRHAARRRPAPPAPLAAPAGGPAGGARPKLSRLAPRESFAPTLAHDVVQLRDAERLIVRLRWLAMASWPPILLAIDPPVSPRLVWTAYGVAVAYVLTTHLLNRKGWAVRATALGTTLADPMVTALICAVTRGLDSELYPFFYLTTLATSIRFGMMETLGVVLVNAALSIALFARRAGIVRDRRRSRRPGVLPLLRRARGRPPVAGGPASLRSAARSCCTGSSRAEEDERRRLAGELHDRVGRRFFEFYSALDRARLQRPPDESATAAQLGRLADAARDCAEEVRAVTNELRPVVLDDFGFVEALRERAAALAAEGDLAVSLEIDAPADAGRPRYRRRALPGAAGDARQRPAARRRAARVGSLRGRQRDARAGHP